MGESEIRIGGARAHPKVYKSNPLFTMLVHKQVYTFFGVPSNNVNVNLDSLNRSKSACVNNQNLTIFLTYL